MSDIPISQLQTDIATADRLLKDIKKLRRPSERIFSDCSRWLFPGVFHNATSVFYIRLINLITARAFHDAVILIAEKSLNKKVFDFDYYTYETVTGISHPVLYLLEDIIAMKKTRFQIELEKKFRRDA